MDISFLFPPAKRSIHGVTGMLEANNPSSAAIDADGGVSSKRSKQPLPPLIVPSGHVALRLLCHSSRIGGVIGKSGAVIKQLQQETAAKIRIEEALPGVDERVIIVIASSLVSREVFLKMGMEDEGGYHVEVSAAQEAAVRVFERILDVAAEADGFSVASRSLVSFRLLAESSQAGSVIGKGGKIVEKIRQETGCKIKVLSPEKSPSCALPNEEIIVIEGKILAVKKALIAVTCRLQDCQIVDRTKVSGGRPPQAVLPNTIAEVCVDLPPKKTSLPSPVPASFVTYASGSHAVSTEAERIGTPGSRVQRQEMIFRLLCSNNRVGGVIGKGGAIIRALQDETGASITIGASIDECDERLITVTSMENHESQYLPAQNAVILVFNRSIEAGREKGIDSSSSEGSLVSARLVVPKNQVGCLLGKGGAIVSEMRKVTGAGIRIIGGDLVPKCASENDQVVQITGEFVNVQDALYNVTCRLRNNLCPSSTPNGAGIRSSSSLFNEISPDERTRCPLSLGLSTSIRIPNGLSRHPSLTLSTDHLGLSSSSDPPSLSSPLAPWTVAGVKSRSMIGVGRGLTSAKGVVDLGSGSRSAIVTNTTVEILVPENVIGSIYGENGSNLARLRQISGAKVVVHEPRPGTTDRIVVISGSPDETQAAQSLLQAFILTESC